jgi:peptidoglycan hydrolase-like protein with peptidoglycan-binding domain
VVLVESGGANGNDPQVVSHGQQGDPCRVPLSVEAASHSGEPITFLRLEAGDGPAPSPGPSSGNPYTPLAVDGSFGPQTTEALQWKLGVTADGQFGPDTKMALQRYLKVTPDGSIGPVTIRALQAHVGATQDGSWGPQTTEALQRALNAGTF